MDLKGGRILIQYLPCRQLTSLAGCRGIFSRPSCEGSSFIRGLGSGFGTRVGVGLGVGDGLGDGLGVGVGDGDLLGLGDSAKLGDGLGLGIGLGLGAGLGDRTDRDEAEAAAETLANREGSVLANLETTEESPNDALFRTLGELASLYG